MCRVRDIVVEAGQLQMDLSPLGSVIAIAPLCLMIPNMFPHRLDIRTITSLDSIGERLTSYQEDRLVLLR